MTHIGRNFYVSFESSGHSASLRRRLAQHTAARGICTRDSLVQDRYDQGKAQQGTQLAEKAWVLCELASDIGSHYLSEFPEDLGTTHSIPVEDAPI